MQMLYIFVTYFDSLNLVLIYLCYADCFLTFRNKLIYNFVISCTDFFDIFFISDSLNSRIDSSCCSLYSQSS